MATLQLQVVSQEKELLNTTVDSVTAPTTSGEITVLPGHIPLFTKLTTGEVRFMNGTTESSIVVSEGFLTVSENDSLIVMVDSATLAREVSEQKAQEAIRAAKETLKISEDKRELLMAEASLKLAMMELKVAQKAKRTRN